MTLVAELIFWGSAALIGYAYWGYPLALFVLAGCRSRSITRADITPPVTFVVTAYNEEKRISEKLENTLLLDYPRDRLEIVVASDCSTDRTDEIVKQFGPRGARLIRAPRRGGKESAQKLAVDAAHGEILVFSDVATILGPNALTNIVKNFADPTVGCVTSVDKMIDEEGKGIGEGAYLRYEMFLRELESRVKTVVGLSGSFFAARREICEPWAVDLQSDFNTLCNAVARGLRGVSDTDTVGYYHPLSDDGLEYHRKVRTVVRGLAVVRHRWYMLNPFRYGLFAWELFSHKVSRWLVPFAMVSALISNAAIAWGPHLLFRATLLFQLAFYALATFGLWIDRRLGTSAFRTFKFFVVVNLSILTAWCRFLGGHQIVRWDPSVRPGWRREPGANPR